MKRPVVACMFCLVSGVVVVLLASMVSINSFLFLPSMISGIIVLIGGVMLYERPSSHSLWSGLVIAVAVADLLGVLYLFMSAPIAPVSPNGSRMSLPSQSLLPTLVASSGPILGLIGGTVGLVWKPLSVRSSVRSLPV